jgi:putative ABC transport system permease protein
MFYVLSIVLVVLFLGLLVGPVLWSDKGRRSLILALRSLWLHKLRAILSVLGIIIGTAAVISLMAFGEGSMQDALEDIKRMGATNIIIRSVKPSEDSSTARRTRVATYGLTRQDYETFATLMEGGTVTRMVPMRIFPVEIRNLEYMHNGRAVGTTPEYQDINQLNLALGRFFNDEDDLRMRNVCVLGSKVAERLFPFQDPMNKTVRLGNYFYKVIGVMRDRMPTGGSGGSQAAEDYNHDVYIPLHTCRARFGGIITYRQAGAFTREQVELSQVTLTVVDTDKVRPTGDIIRDYMNKAHGKADWAVTVPLDRLEEAERAKDRYTMLLAVIAGISLLVGGIGIMNIMLATVTERTREIGIRRALGAKRRDIILQFLIEAVVQTTLGGLVGAASGLSIAWAAPRVAAWFAANLPAKVNVPSIFVSMAVAVIVGVAFGLYPAFRASRLDPIEALRHE